MTVPFLKELFAGFLRARHLVRHFRRLLVLETWPTTGLSREVSPALTLAIVEAAKTTPEALLGRLETDADGLTESQANTGRAE